MIRQVTGDLLEADVEALVNTVNTEGVMGKGIALQFKKTFPEMFREYEKLCASGQLQPGQVHVYERGELLNPRYIINFPTKRHWREKAKLQYIREGLQALVSEVQLRHIRSLAIPALGSGLGELKWDQVFPLIKEACAQLPDVCVFVYPPQPAPDAAQIVHRTDRPPMTLSRARVLHVLQAYTVLGNELTLLEIQKLLYFLQVAGEPLSLRYEKYWYGPYADNLRHVLNRFEGHFIQGFANARNAPKTSIVLLPDALQEAESLIAQAGDADVESDQRLHRVMALIEGFESPHGMELLASVHWVATHQAGVTDAQTALRAIHQWSEGKRDRLRPEHVQIAWQRLIEQGWLEERAITQQQA
jgi:O-acetyl-ADP-ribose deacetylase (regulator of RNase III)